MTSHATPGAKMLYLIKARPTTGREELVAHWFGNHMPAVIADQARRKAAGKPHSWRYIATLYDADETGRRVWDGMAQLWWDQALPQPSEPHGTSPTDSFQERAEPYVPWATTEYVLLAGPDEKLPATPLTLNDPFPTTRSGFHKVTILVAAKPGSDHDAFHAHWLDVHAPNVIEVMQRCRGWRYVLSLSTEPASAPYAGAAELYFDEADNWKAFITELKPDGMAQWTAGNQTVILPAMTEMIGIP